ncbi:hypothetical protein T484DRAFT_1918524 [Baffinella frigidus]|nr:hypothetical protein T484DRAFT_1918524 [Cryptophyta sp. CCMP2293]
MCALTLSPSLSDAAIPPHHQRASRSSIVDESCAASNASTVSQEEARDNRVEDVPKWVDVSERKPHTATFGLAKSLWQPDAEALTCSLLACGREFHRFLRRHHCRVCGRVVCADCSKGRRRLLPETGSGTRKALDARACDVCYHSADLYNMSRTITPSPPPRTGIMSAPWGWYAAGLPRPRSETRLPAPLATSPPSDAAGLPSDWADQAQGANEAAATCSAVVPADREEEQDHVLQALRDKFAHNFFYGGMLLHEPKALDLLLRCTADQMRSREMEAGAPRAELRET